MKMFFRYTAFEKLPSAIRVPTLVLLVTFLTAIALIIVVGTVEIIVRNPGLYEDDAQLGWKVHASYHEERSSTDCAGTPVAISFSTQGDGFREFGNLQAPRKLLIIGDSFTINHDVSDGKTYSAVLGKLLHSEVFTYGAGGYGSLQEFCILKAFFDQIKPDAVLIQVCTNDVINNSFQLERQSVINNNIHPRPYLEDDGTIRLRTPYFHWSQAVIGAIGDLFQGKSRSISRLQQALQLRFFENYKDVSVETAIENGVPSQDYRQALATTRRIFEKIHAASGQTPVYAFIMGEGRLARDLTDTLDGTGVTVLGGVDEELFAGSGTGPSLRAADCGHLSAYGNEKLGRILAARLSPYQERLFRRPEAAAGSVDAATSGSVGP